MVSVISIGHDSVTVQGYVLSSEAKTKEFFLNDCSVKVQCRFQFEHIVLHF